MFSRLPREHREVACGAGVCDRMCHRANAPERVQKWNHNLCQPDDDPWLDFHWVDTTDRVCTDRNFCSTGDVNDDATCEQGIVHARTIALWQLCEVQGPCEAIRGAFGPYADEHHMGQNSGSGTQVPLTNIATAPLWYIFLCSTSLLKRCE